jgi:hypothetical protein
MSFSTVEGQGRKDASDVNIQSFHDNFEPTPKPCKDRRLWGYFFVSLRFSSLCQTPFSSGSIAEKPVDTAFLSIKNYPKRIEVILSI